tara:strand:- start:2198 stop:2437 length:240 start_codon:yes stop_codon:yes gene_type:complete
MRIMVSEKQLENILSNEREMGEQEDGTETGTGDAGAGTTAGSKKWETGIERGPANQLAVTKWSDIVGQLTTRGKANPIW